MNYTEENLKNVVKKILGDNTFSAYENNFVMAMHYAAMKLWVDEIILPKNEERLLRQAFQQLKNPGFFTFGGIV